MSATAALPRAISAEWIKLKSVRSTRWTLATFVGLTVGIGAIIGYAVNRAWSDSMDASDKLGFEATGASLQGLAVGQLVIAVLGVLAVTAEYSSGTIRATLAAIPRRNTVVGAKAIVFAAVALVVSAVTVAASYLVAQALMKSTGVTTSIGDKGVIGLLLGAVVFLVLTGLLAMGLGLVIRSTAGAITTMVGIAFILPIVTNFIPGKLGVTLSKYTPNSLGDSLTSLQHEAGSVSPGMAAAIMVLYAAVALAAGAFFLARRDA